MYRHLSAVVALLLAGCGSSARVSTPEPVTTASQVPQSTTTLAAVADRRLGDLLVDDSVSFQTGETVDVEVYASGPFRSSQLTSTDLECFFDGSREVLVLVSVKVTNTTPNFAFRVGREASVAFGESVNGSFVGMSPFLTRIRICGGQYGAGGSAHDGYSVVTLEPGQSFVWESQFLFQDFVTPLNPDGLYSEFTAAPFQVFASVGSPSDGFASFFAQFDGTETGRSGS